MTLAVWSKDPSFSHISIYINMKNDESDSEEEILVYAEFEDSVNIEKYRGIHILGVDGKSPIVQMDDTFFMGKYKNSLGTYMFFEEDQAPKRADPLFDKLPEKNLKYLCKTRKYINMEHAYVTPKEGKEQNLLSQLPEQPGDNIEPIEFKTIQEALEAFRCNFTSEIITVETEKD